MVKISHCDPTNQYFLKLQSKRVADNAKPAQKGVKQKLGSGPCPNVRIRDVDGTFSDMEAGFEDLQSDIPTEEEKMWLENDFDADKDVVEEDGNEE